MRKLLVILFIQLCFFSITSCSHEKNIQPILSDENKIEKVNIFEIKDFNDINPVLIKQIKSKELIDKIVIAITSAEKQSGDMNTIQPNYMIEIVMLDGKNQNYYLWIFNDYEKSMIKKTENTTPVYIVSNKSTTDLKEIID